MEIMNQENLNNEQEKMVNETFSHFTKAEQNYSVAGNRSRHIIYLLET